MKKNNFRRLFLMLFLSAVFFTAHAQEDLMIRGAVTSASDGLPLPGVNIIIQGTTTGTISNVDGNYELQVPDPANAVLVFKFIGFADLEVPVNNQTTINVQLEEDVIGLDEVVAIGYGTVSKKDLTGSVGSLDAEMVTEKGTTSPLESIQGSVAGVQISSTTGRIGDGFDIQIRGQNTMSEDNAPLYVVDGVITDGIDFLNPQDIARIDILKDASSTAIYGSRGTNGVVIVTTKQGADAKSKAVVTYDGYYGVRTTARLPELMDGEKWWYYHKSAYLATASDSNDDGIIDAQEHEAAYLGTNNSELLRRAQNNETTDWYDEVLKNGKQQNHYISVSGASENVSYVMGIGYQNEEGNLENESLDKYSFKTSVNHKVSDKVTAGATLNVSLTEQEMGSQKAMREAFRLNPLLSPRDSIGNLVPQPGKYTTPEGDYLVNKTSTFNPILEINNSSDNTRRYNGVGNAFLEFKPTNGLALKTTFSIGYDQSRRGRSWGALTDDGFSNDQQPLAQRDTEEDLNYTWDNQVTYEKNFGSHHFNAMGLYSIYERRIETSMMYTTNLPFESQFYNMGTGAQSSYNIGSNYIKTSLMSYVLRLNYDFDNKYLITLSNRWDGSSNLSEGNKWKAFPSGAFAWRVSEEPFMENWGALSNLKARLSYGLTGNNNVDPYATLSYADQQTYYDFNGTTALGFIPSQIANNLLTWETTTEINFGIDFGFLRNRIAGSFDIYNRLSEDLLMLQKLPKETGWEDMTANVGSVRNKGVELSLNTVNIDTGDFSWRTSFTFSKNTNEIETLYGQSEVDDVANGWFIGEAINSEYNYKFDGIWQANEAAEAASYGQTEGQAKVLDVNDDGVIDPDDDRMILGSNDPDWSGSFSTKFKYKGLDLSMTMFTNQGVFVYSGFHSNFVDMRDRGRAKLDVANWYIPENGAGLPAQYSNEYPQPRNGGTYWRNDGVGYYREADFVKIKNISLGYTFETNVANRLGMSSLRIYTNVLNPFVFSDYDGFDPEWAGSDYGDGGVSFVTYQFGINARF